MSLFWVVDPEAMSISVFFPDGASQIYTITTPLIDTLLPGLKLTTRQVFEEAELI